MNFQENERSHKKKIISGRRTKKKGNINNGKGKRERYKTASLVKNKKFLSRCKGLKKNTMRKIDLDLIEVKLQSS